MENSGVDQKYPDSHPPAPAGWNCSCGATLCDKASDLQTGHAGTGQGGEAESDKMIIEDLLRI